MAFSPSNQYFCMTFLQWSRFLRKRNICGNFIFVGTYFSDREKKRKNHHPDGGGGGNNTLSCFMLQKPG